jgi:Fe-S-cluster-containing hydrogenase component 2
LCSAVNEGEFKPASSRIKIISHSRVGISTPNVCLQCENAWCEQACDYEAIERNEATGAMIIDKDKCIGCQECIPSCPYGMIRFDGEKKIAVKCDLCNGNPKCVEACYHRAIRLIEFNNIS